MASIPPFMLPLFPIPSIPHTLLLSYNQLVGLEPESLGQTPDEWQYIPTQGPKAVNNTLSISYYRLTEKYESCSVHPEITELPIRYLVLLSDHPNGSPHFIRLWHGVATPRLLDRERGFSLIIVIRDSGVMIPTKHLLPR